MTTQTTRLARLEQQWPAASPALPPNPVALARRAGLHLDPWQERVVRSRAQQQLLNVTRQGGKSTIASVLAVDTALRQPGSLVLLVSRALRQSGELFKKCLDVYRAAGRLVPAEAETKLTLELQGGSRIVSLPGSEETVRGFSAVTLLVFDEAARVPDALYRALRPVLAVSGGRVLAMSTPWGQRGWFWQEWTEGGVVWERTEIPAAQCGRIPAAFLARERRSLGAWWFSQEYECQFRAADDSVFDYAAIQAAVSAEVEPLAFGAAGRWSA